MVADAGDGRRTAEDGDLGGSAGGRRRLRLAKMKTAADEAKEDGGAAADGRWTKRAQPPPPPPPVGCGTAAEEAEVGRAAGHRGLELDGVKNGGSGTDG